MQASVKKYISLPFILLIIVFYCLPFLSTAQKRSRVDIWDRFELALNSYLTYTNPIYDAALEATFTSPSGKTYKTDGFWDGENRWKIRFMPNEKGIWHYQTRCTDSTNNTLHNQTGKLVCRGNPSSLAIYKHGKVTHTDGNYYITHPDGTPFFYLGCTAWNGAMRSTDDEWKRYLSHRKKHHYTVIQFVTTQWRGLPAEVLEDVAFTGRDTLTINPVFFQNLDKKIGQINREGLVAAPVMLWAWGGSGNPGIDLPIPSAIKLAKYLKARYDAYHVIWNLGGDGNFTGNDEEKWKQIGRAVFGEGHARQSMVTLHTGGFKWYARAYDEEPWLDMVSYQTGHANSESAVRWKTEGPVVSDWRGLTPRPIIDTEPVYEGQGDRENDYEVRKSILWSIFSAPVAGVGYGAWSTWPWLRVGEKSYNHGMKEPSKYSWEDGIKSKASLQVGLLRLFFSRFNWWELKPLQNALLAQSGGDDIFHRVLMLADADTRTMMAYLPIAQTIKIKHEDPTLLQNAQWYYPATGSYETANLIRGVDFIEATSNSDTDAILILTSKPN